MNQLDKMHKFKNWIIVVGICTSYGNCLLKIREHSSITSSGDDVILERSLRSKMGGGMKNEETNILITICLARYPHFQAQFWFYGTGEY